MAPASLFPGIHIEELPTPVKTIAGVATGITAFVGGARRGAVNKAMHVPSFAEFERIFGGLMAGAELGYAVRQFFLNGGTDALVVRIAQRASEAQALKGLRALDRVDFFNLLALPGITEPRILASAADFCRERRAFLLIDPPEKTPAPAELEQLVQSGALPKTSFAAMYFPWTTIADPLSGQPRAIPPSGSIAGLIARTDRTQGVWKAPAGTAATLAGVSGLARKFTDAQLARLTPLGINALRVLPSGQVVVWGARTLAGTDVSGSEWKYLPVRRLGLFIEESIRRGTKWAVFEPNGEPLWALLRRSVGAFLDSLFRAGALPGDTPRNAYFVKCDAQTMTPADIAAGLFTVQVGFAPLKPAEFIVLTIRQPTASAPR